VSSSSAFSELALGRYQPGESPLHRSPAWGKAALLSSLAVGLFWLESGTAYALFGLALAATARLAGLAQRDFWRSLRPLLLLAALTLAAGAFLTPPEASLLSPRFSWSGLHKGALYAARLLLITLLTTLFFLTTRPDDAISLGVRLMAPLSLLGIEPKELSLLVHLAYRFVPLLVREIDEMRWGRLARNLHEPRTPLSRMRHGMDSLITVVIGALHRAETTALALQQKGLLEHWRPAPLSRGQGLALWPLASLGVLEGVLLMLDSALV
jgi:energy-coupling factor transporter transmembrane protein EcfT